MNQNSKDNTCHSPETDENKVVDDSFRHEQLIEFLVSVSIFISQHERDKENG